MALKEYKPGTAFSGVIGRTFDVSSPAVNVDIDRDRAAALGITPSQIETALGASFGGTQI